MWFDRPKKVELAPLSAAAFHCAPVKSRRGSR
jgi:hypothetical protein